MAFDATVDVGPTNQSGGTSASDFLKQLEAALATLGGGAAGRAIANHAGNPLTQAVPPQLSQLLDNSVARQGYQNPLFQATTQGTYDMLPTFAKKGTALSGSLPSVIPPSANTGGGGGGGMGPGTAAGLGALAGLLGPGSGGNLGKIVDAIKKLFQRNHGGTVQGNKPYSGGALTGPGAYDPTQFMGWDTSGQGGGHGLNPNVTTETNFSWPNDVFNDPYFLNSQWNGMPNDPSGGSGVGPGMYDFRHGGSGLNDPYADGE